MLALLFALHLWFPFLHPQPVIKSPEALVDRVTLSLVRVTMEVYDEQSDKMQTHVCAGWVTSASKGEAITARHCVDPEKTIAVDGVDTVLLRFNDLFALVQVPRMSRPPLELAPSAPPRGAIVVSVGYGYGQLTSLVRNVAAFDADSADIALGGPLIPGMSGGPTVDERGYVVGLNQASNEFVGIICGVEELRLFLAGK